MKQRLIAVLLFAGAVLAALALTPPPARACYNYCVYIQCMLEDRYPYGYFKGNRYDQDNYVLLEGGSFDCDGYSGIIFPSCSEYPCGGGGPCPPMYGSRFSPHGSSSSKKQDATSAQGEVYIGIAKRKLVKFVLSGKELAQVIVFLQRNPRTNREKLVKQVQAKFHPISTETISPDEATLVGGGGPAGGIKILCLC